MGDAPAPMFNASIQYLIMITKLIEQGLMSSMEKNTEVLFYVCEGLHSMLWPRAEPEERTEMTDSLKRMRTNRVTHQTKNTLTTSQWHYDLNDWFNDLNFTAHALKLLMNDKISTKDKFKDV